MNRCIRAGLPALLSLLAWALDGAVIEVSAQAPPAACGARADGGPPVAERGIGGTGAPTRLADRGIGGTGAPVTKVGVRGRITGFGSLCVNGLEVTLPKEARVLLDGRTGAAGDLRVGFVTEFLAERTAGGGLSTGLVSVAHEVVGPVEQQEPGRTGLIVAGQRVRLGAQTRVAEGVARGDWVAVSGLRDGSGAVWASRIDRAPAGRVIISGVAVRGAGGLMLGRLALPGADPRLAGSRVVAEGAYAGSFMRVESLRAAGLPAGGGQLVLEALAVSDGRVLRTGEGLTVPLGTVAPAALLPEVPVLVTLAVSSGGDLSLMSVHESAAGEGSGGRAESGAAGGGASGGSGAAAQAPNAGKASAAPSGDSQGGKAAVSTTGDKQPDSAQTTGVQSGGSKESGSTQGSSGSSSGSSGGSSSGGSKESGGQSGGGHTSSR